MTLGCRTLDSDAMEDVATPVLDTLLTDCYCESVFVADEGVVTVVFCMLPTVRCNAQVFLIALHFFLTLMALPSPWTTCLT